MMKKFIFVLVGLLFILAAVSLSAPAVAQTGGSYDLSWSSVDGGGATPQAGTGGGYTLGGTIGQPDAGTLVRLDYSLAGGFWNDMLDQLRVFLPLIFR